jgi:hypothetical protein
MENPIYEFKKQQKELAAKIRSEKGNDVCSYTFRHNHIAYCEIRGRERSQIENPREGNEPSEDLIQRTKDAWLLKITAWREANEKTLCDCD